MTLAYVGLGSNLGDREATIRRAAELIGAARLSPLVETEPWGLPRPAAFLNAAAEVETPLSARAFLDHLLDVERRLGRERVGPRWGPRTIDLDLLLWGDERISEPGLEVPHPLCSSGGSSSSRSRRSLPDREIPGNGTVSEALAGLQSAA